MDFTDDGPVWTDEERHQIAAEQDAIAARLWKQFERAEESEDADFGHRLRLRNLACEAERLAVAARHSSAALARLY